MADKSVKSRLLSFFPENSEALSIHDIQALLPEPVAERTLRRWLSESVDSGYLLKLGQKRATRYQPKLDSKRLPQLKFLDDLPEEQKEVVIKQLRDLWTHSSTALEGNTLSLGDTHFVLEEGLTISGKPLKEHQEIIGHACAIELVYQSLNSQITETFCFELHKAVQTEIIFDIDKPNGAWKIRPNGTYTVDVDDKQLYLEYALPQHVPQLMREVITLLNVASTNCLKLENAHICYAKIHAAIAHIHPFWDGNGRIARLLANLPLLKSGLPPIIIPKDKRRNYIQLLAAYELAAGQLDQKSGVWPKPELLKDFEALCLQCYQSTREIIRG